MFSNKQSKVVTLTFVVICDNTRVILYSFWMPHETRQVGNTDRISLTLQMGMIILTDGEWKVWNRRTKSSPESTECVTMAFQDSTNPDLWDLVPQILNGDQNFIICLPMILFSDCSWCFVTQMKRIFDCIIFLTATLSYIIRLDLRHFPFLPLSTIAHKSNSFFC